MRTYLVILVMSTVSIFCSNKRSKNVDVERQIADSVFLQEGQYVSSVFNSDTLIDTRTGFFHIKHLDSTGHLIRKIVTNPYESDSRKIFSDVESYNAAGLLVEDSKFSGLLLWHNYKFKWDTQGRLIEKRGFGSGDSGSQEFYVYENGFTIRRKITSGRELVDTLR